MSSLAQGMGLGLALLHIPVGSRDSGNEGTLSKCATDWGTGCCPHTGRKGGHPEEMGRLEKGACANLMEFSVAECKVLWTGVQVGQRMD